RSWSPRSTTFSRLACTCRPNGSSTRFWEPPTQLGRSPPLRPFSFRSAERLTDAFQARRDGSRQKRPDARIAHGEARAARRAALLDRADNAVIREQCFERLAPPFERASFAVIENRTFAEPLVGFHQRANMGRAHAMR